MENSKNIQLALWKKKILDKIINFSVEELKNYPDEIQTETPVYQILMSDIEKIAHEQMERPLKKLEKEWLENYAPQSFKLREHQIICDLLSEAIYQSKDL